MTTFLWGAIMMAYAVSGLFMLKFWTETRDRLFLLFALAFWILSLNQTMLLGMPATDEGLPVYFIVRLMAFLLLLAAIVDKNRKSRR